MSAGPPTASDVDASPIRPATACAYAATVARDLVLLVVGFLLTTVVGGLLTYVYQRRAWNADRRERERERAMEVLEEASRGMDRRLYRMRQVVWTLEASSVADEALEEQMRLYRQVVSDWNETLNRRLALVQTYFGPRVLRLLECEVYERLKRLGAAIEAAYRARERSTATSPPDLAGLTADLEKLGDSIYELNVAMITVVKRPRYQPEPGEREPC